jgi:hypothetical protein
MKMVDKKITLLIILIVFAGGGLAEGIDLDGDGVPDANDNCPDVPNPDQADSDGTPVEDFVSYWKLDEGAGTIAEDSVGSNDGTLEGATWSSGIIGGALS